MENIIIDKPKQKSRTDDQSRQLQTPNGP